MIKWLTDILIKPYTIPISDKYLDTLSKYNKLQGDYEKLNARCNNLHVELMDIKTTINILQIQMENKVEKS